MTDADRIPTNLRTLLILEILGRADEPLTPTQINEHLDLPKQTVHRLCTTLEQEGFLTRCADGKRMKPARRLMDLGAGLIHSARDFHSRHQILEQIAQRVNEAVNYVVPQESGMHYLDRVDTDWPLRIQLPVGSHVPFHCTASGKAYMASMAPAARRAFVAALDLKPLTEATILTPAALLEELAQIRKQGFAIDNGEFMEGMVALAVPVTDPSGRYLASLAFHGPSQRLTVAQAIAQKTIIQDGAEKLRDSLFE
ncbi:IclR family transcriptional regulator [Neptunicoccus cionae]|uniref:IclR family transcriptional regulator n=1 Tax=Neptunicoccus cionae TaxID=2035344 RepID=A0A916QPD4_9RHOB|nr:IclR family transcriptional regulator [Amylibacter cionae]GGA05415.1 IclR family transcriptional regulator [Amylibacter cionae]